MGTNGMVTSGHYLASRIGLSVLEPGEPHRAERPRRRGQRRGRRGGHGVRSGGFRALYLRHRG
jgi:hypothetical protein